MDVPGNEKPPINSASETQPDNRTKAWTQFIGGALAAAWLSESIIVNAFVSQVEEAVSYPAIVGYLAVSYSGLKSLLQSRRAQT